MLVSSGTCHFIYILKKIKYSISFIQVCNPKEGEKKLCANVRSTKAACKPN
jgi:hypothetical protein